MCFHVYLITYVNYSTNPIHIHLKFLITLEFLFKKHYELYRMILYFYLEMTQLKNNKNINEV